MTTNDKNTWRYSKDNQALGPTSISDIIDLYNLGELDDKTRVWNGTNVKDWTYIKDVPIFATKLSPSPITISSPSPITNNIIQIINNLRGVGAEMEIDLPCIALCGQQSSGKSSLTEAISGVSMPRNAGTCTRCPTEIRLIQCDDILFKCDIGIRYEYDDIKQIILPSIKEEHIGSTNDRSKVSSIVTKAQKHILERNGLQFSRNVITVTIYDSNCLNLTIMDLPGLIFAIEKREDAKFIDLIRNLVIDTIKKPNTLIASVISCKDDMENQIINQLAREYDPNGIRTIGILTKIDTIESGLENEWINILLNKKYPLKLGYVAIKNPNQKELMQNLTYQQIRNIEEKTFEKYPWNQLSLEIKQRYGTLSLIRILSDTLASFILKKLPKMKLIIQNKLINVQNELKQLPSIPFNDNNNESPTEILFTTLTKYCDNLKNLVRMNDSDFWEDAMVELQIFQKKLTKVKPRFASGNKYLNKLKVSTNDKLIYSMQDVVNQKQKNRKRGIGCSRKHFVQNSMNHWELITRDIVTNCSTIFAKHINNIGQQTLLPYRTLHRVASFAAMDLLQQVTNNTMEHVLYLLQRELNSEFTLSTQRLHATYTSALDQLCHAFNIEKKNEKQFDENEAIMIMANSISYYDMAFRRHSDVTAMAIEDMLFNGFINKIDSIIRKKLNLFNANQETIQKLLKEDSSIAQKRQNLLKRLQTLQNIAKELTIIIPKDIDTDNDDEYDNDNDIDNNDNDDQHQLDQEKDIKDKKKKKNFMKSLFK